MVSSMLLSMMVFLSVLGFLTTELAGGDQTSILSNPIVLSGAIGVAAIAVIGAGNTPIVRGATMVLLATLIFTKFWLDFTTLGINQVFVSLFLLPMSIAFAFVFIESSKGG